MICCVWKTPLRMIRRGGIPASTATTLLHREQAETSHQREIARCLKDGKSGPFRAVKSS